MMNKLKYLIPLILFLISVPVARGNQAARGFCEAGAQPVVTSGLTSTTQVQASYPACTITVFVTGGGVAQIFSDNAGTPLANPFTANSNGQWIFFAANGTYDVQMSGAGFTSPVTLSSILLADPANQQAALPNTTLAFSSTPAFNATNNISYTMTLTGNVTSSTITGTPANGNLLSLTIVEDAVGGRTFAFPPSFILPLGFTFSTLPLATNALTFKFDGTNWNLISNSGSGSGGATPAPPTNSLQKNNGSNALAASLTSDDGATLNVDENSAFKGPNPWVDITRYNARSTNTSIAPQVPGITVTAATGSTSATLSSASSFQNLDWVYILGGGPACGLSTPSAPTVIPSLSAGPTGVGIDINATAAATTYNYKYIAMDATGCYTAASPVGTTTTGLASLGAQTTATITSIARSATTNTVTMSAPTNLVTGTDVEISQTSHGSFGGRYVITVTDSTHFTYTSNFDTNSSAVTSATGGKATWYSNNHINLTHVANALRYIVYSDRATPGTFVPICVTRPDDGIYNDGALYCNDYGSPMNDALTLPFWIPTTAPSVAGNQNLSAQINAGAGTTSVTLSTPITNPSGVTAATILFDNTPAIVAAATAAGASGNVYIPTGTFVINSYLTMPNAATVCLAGGLALNETIQISNYWNGDCIPHIGNTPLFSFTGHPLISAGRAYPAIYVPAPSNSFTLNGVTVSGQANHSQLLIIDKGNPVTVTNSNFQSTGSADYLGMNIELRGAPADTVFQNRFENLLLSTGLNQVAGSSSTPLMYLNNVGITSFTNLSVNRRGILLRPTQTGLKVNLAGQFRTQGGINPDFISYFTGGAASVALNATGSVIELDTMAHPFFTNFSGAFASVAFGAVDSPSFDGVSNPPLVSGLTTLVTGGTFVSGFTSRIAGPFFSNNKVQVIGTGAGFGYKMAAPVAPTVSAIAGGGLTAGTYNIAIDYVDALGNESDLSPTAPVTTTPGNLTIHVVPPAVPANSGTVGYYVYINGIKTGTSSTVCPVIASTSNFDVTIGFQNPCGQLFVTGVADSSVIGGNGVNTPTLILSGGGFTNTISGTFTAARTLTIPDITGTAAVNTFANQFSATQTITSGNELHFLGSNATNFEGFKVNASLASNLVWALPLTDSTGTQCLSSNGSLGLAWSACSGGTGTPGGAVGNVQYNNTTFAGSNAFTFNGTDTVSIGQNATTLGKLTMFGNTSGSVTLQSNAIAGSSIVLTLPSTTGTLASSGTTPITVTSGTGAVGCPTCSTNASSLTANAILLGNGSNAIVALGSLGTTTTVLHGNAAGAPSFAAVSLTADVTGTLPIANGGTGQVTAGAAFNALGPSTALGGLIVGSGSNTYANLPIGSNGSCLTVTGGTAVWGSCAAGAVSGTGVAAQMTFWSGTSTITGSANNTYSASSGYSLVQGANAADLINGKRFTNTVPTGNFFHFLDSTGGTDVAKLDVNGNLTVTGAFITTSATGVAGTFSAGQGTSPALVANTVQLIAPISVAAGGEQIIFPGTGATGYLRGTNLAGVVTLSYLSASGTGNCLSTQLVQGLNDGSTPSCVTVSGTMFASASQNLVFATPNGSSGTPSIRALVGADIPAITLNTSGNGGVTSTLPITNGGTGQVTALTAFNALSCLTTAGDIIYGGASGSCTRLAAGTTSQVLIGGTTPSWGSISLTGALITGILPIASGGTNASAAPNTNGVFYFDGTRYVSTATGGGGTLCLISVSGATPGFGSCAGSASTVWSALTAAAADLTLAQTTFNSTFTNGIMTGTRDAWNFSDSASTSTGSFFNIHTGASSTLKPITITAVGTANGVQMSAAGVFAKLGAGSVVADSTSLTISTTSPLGGGGAFNTNLTLTCATCVVSAASLTSNQIVAGSGGGQGVSSANLSGAISTAGTLTTTMNGPYNIVTCTAGFGDGTNAMAAATYLQFNCPNLSGVTRTITAIKCWTDNAGSSTLAAANNAGTALLTGAVTCNATKSSAGAAGTQSGTTTIVNNDALSFTFVADGTSKQALFTVTFTQ